MDDHFMTQLDSSHKPDGKKYISTNQRSNQHSPFQTRTEEQTRESIQHIPASSKNAEHTSSSHKLKPRHTTHYNSWHYKDMILAIKEVQGKHLSMTAAAKKYSIPRTTLRHYLNDGTNKEAKRLGFFLPKEQENLLVEFALKHYNLTEKHLYKYIFEKAKALCDSTLTGEEDRRVIPTPAWIRRFVYRQKKLHTLFPTLLSKFEHPLHGGRKSSTNESSETQPRDSHNYPRASMVEDNSSWPMTSQYENAEDDGSLFTDSSTQSYNSIKSRSHSESYITTMESTSPKHKKTFFSSSAPPLINQKWNSPPIRYTQYGETAHMANLKSHGPLEAEKGTNDPLQLRSSFNCFNYRDQKIYQDPSFNDHSISPNYDHEFVSKQPTRSTTPPPPVTPPNIHRQHSSLEIQVTKTMLQTMELELGDDYVNLFKERYAANKSLERFYCKWLSLKTEIERMENVCLHEFQ